jgi:hypothetical protein
VQDDERVRRGRAHDAPVDFNPRLAVDARAEFANDASADAHAPRSDDLFGSPARRDAGGREVFLEPQAERYTFFRSNVVMNSSFVFVRASAA